MLYHLFNYLAEDYSVFNVFRYITTRAGGAILTAILLSFWITPRLIRWLKSIQSEGQPIRDCMTEAQLLKKGTPTMGGLMILLTVLISTLLWANLTNAYVWICIFVMVSFGVLGFIDDYSKLKRKSSDGISSRQKMLWQIIFAAITCYLIMWQSDKTYETHISVPFLKDIFINLGWFYMIFIVAMIVGASNAVNFTDGMDGLAIVPIMIATMCFALIAYLVGNAIFSAYLNIPSVPNSGEIAIICTAIFGAGLGFLWYNAPPAHVFMGDTGSLSLGALLGTIAAITKHEIVLAIIGGLFVIEALSVIIQIGYFKLTGKRVFLMAPIHHHFEKKGWNEPTIVIRFWIIAVIFAIIGLATLKLR